MSGMIVGLLIALVVGCGRTAEDIPTAYSGLQITQSKDEVRSKFSGIIEKTVEATWFGTWPNITRTYGQGFFSASFSLSHIVCESATYDPKKLSIYNLTAHDNMMYIEQTGPAVAYVFTFSYDFQLFHMSLIYGTAKTIITSREAHYCIQFLNQEEEINTVINWEAKSEISGWDFFGGVTKSIMSLLNPEYYIRLEWLIEQHMIPVLKTAMEPWLHINNFLHENHMLDMMFENSYDDVREHPPGFITFGFCTNVTVSNRPYNKMVWRRLSSSVSMNRGKAQACISNDLITSMLEIQGKARDFLVIIPPEKLHLTGRVSDLFPLMPRLALLYDPNVALLIGCRPEGNHELVTITRSPYVAMPPFLFPAFFFSSRYERSGSLSSPASMKLQMTITLSRN